MKLFHSHSYTINLSTLQNKDRSYTGFIKVHFRLVRPISLPPPQSPEDDQQGGRMKRRTSFYLPKDTAKHLHISSQTRVREVIEALLNKFTLVDNPAKFALFERTEKQNQGKNPQYCVVTRNQYSAWKYYILDFFSFFCLFYSVHMRKLSDDECPLYLRLCAGPSEKVLSLVLKENETGDVNVSFHLRMKSYDKLVSLYRSYNCF